MGFSGQEYWSELPFSSGDLSDPEIKPTSLKSPALAGGFFMTGYIWEPANAKGLSEVKRKDWLFVFIFFPFIFISWRLITLQYCNVFCHTVFFSLFKEFLLKQEFYNPNYVSLLSYQFCYLKQK